MINPAPTPVGSPTQVGNRACSRRWKIFDAGGSTVALTSDLRLLSGFSQYSCPRRSNSSRGDQRRGGRHFAFHGAIGVLKSRRFAHQIVDALRSGA